MKHAVLLDIQNSNQLFSKLNLPEFVKKPYYLQTQWQKIRAGHEQCPPLIIGQSKNYNK